MKTKYNNLIGKTKCEVLEVIEEDVNNYFNSDECFFYLGKSYMWQKKYQYLLFEENIVIRSSIILKNIWEKKIL